MGFAFIFISTMDENKDKGAPIRWHLWVIAAVLAVVAFVAVLVARMNFSLIGWIDTFFLSGGIMLMCFLLYLFARLGAFDMFAYGFKDVAYHMNPSPDKKKKYADYVDYVNSKKENRKRNPLYFWPFITFSGALLITALILRLVLYIQTGY